MSQVKPSKEVLDKLVARRARIQALIQENGVIAGGEKSDLWRAIARKVGVKREGIDGQLDNYEKFSHDQLVAMLESRRELRFFGDLPKDSAVMVRHLERDLTALNEEIDEYRARLKKLS